MRMIGKRFRDQVNHHRKKLYKWAIRFEITSYKPTWQRKTTIPRKNAPSDKGFLSHT